MGWAVILLPAIIAVPLRLLPQEIAGRQLRAGAQCLAAGHLQCADEALNSVLRATPGDYRALDLLGVVRVLQKREADAEDLFTRAVQSKPDFASAHAHLGLLYLQMGRSGQAVAELREAVRLDPARTDASDALVHLWRGEARLAATSGDLEKALALLIDARRLAPNNPDVEFEVGTVALRMSLFEDAAGSFRHTLELRRQDPPAMYGLGRALMGLAKFEDARQQFVRYVAARPDDPAGHCALGMTLAALEHAAEARIQFEKSIALDSTQTESYYRLGLLDLASGDFDSASKNLRHALDRDSRNSGALTALGRVEFGQKRYAEAADLLQRAIASDNSLGEAHYYLGLTFARMGRKAESDRELQTAVELEHKTSEKLQTIPIIGPTPAAPSAAVNK